MCWCTPNGVSTGQVATVSAASCSTTSPQALDRLAVEGGHHPLAGGQVLLLVEQQHAVLAHDRAEDGVALAGVEGVGRAGEHLADVLGLAQHDGPAGRGDVHREHVAVLALPARRRRTLRPAMNITVCASRAAAGRAAAPARVGQRSRGDEAFGDGHTSIYTDVYDARLDEMSSLDAVGHREQLLAAARTLLETRGYAHITARDLVAESGTNLASIGYHFGSKAALLNQAIEDAFADWARRLADLVMADPDATPIQRAWTTWAAVLDAMPTQRPLLQAYVEALAQAQREPELRAQLAAHMREVRRMVAERVAESLGDGTPADDAALPRGRVVRDGGLRRAGAAMAARPGRDADRRSAAQRAGRGVRGVVPARADGQRLVPPLTSRTAGRTSAR